MEFTCDESPTDEENTNEEHISSMFLSIYCPLYSNNQHPNCYIQGI